MVSTSAAPLYRFTIVYTEAPTLTRILDAFGRFGLEPSWLFSRSYKKKQFRVEVRLGDLCPIRASTLAGRLSNLPTVAKVQYAAINDDRDVDEEPLLSSTPRAG